MKLDPSNKCVVVAENEEEAKWLLWYFISPKQIEEEQLKGIGRALCGGADIAKETIRDFEARQI